MRNRHRQSHEEAQAADLPSGSFTLQLDRQRSLDNIDHRKAVRTPSPSSSHTALIQSRSPQKPSANRVLEEIFLKFGSRVEIGHEPSTPNPVLFQRSIRGGGLSVSDCLCSKEHGIELELVKSNERFYDAVRDCNLGTTHRECPEALNTDSSSQNDMGASKKAPELPEIIEGLLQQENIDSHHPKGSINMGREKSCESDSTLAASSDDTERTAGSNETLLQPLNAWKEGPNRKSNRSSHKRIGQGEYKHRAICAMVPAIRDHVRCQSYTKKKGNTRHIPLAVILKRLEAMCMVADNTTSAQIRFKHLMKAVDMMMEALQEVQYEIRGCIVPVDAFSAAFYNLQSQQVVEDYDD